MFPHGKWKTTELSERPLLEDEPPSSKWRNTRQSGQQWKQQVALKMNLVQLHTDYWKGIMENDGPEWARPQLWGWCLKHYNLNFS